MKHRVKSWAENGVPPDSSCLRDLLLKEDSIMTSMENHDVEAF